MSQQRNLSVSVVRSKPTINVTPLIDVLLVMLIIFMVAAPLKPQRFLTKVPSQPDQAPNVDPPLWGLVVTIRSDRSLMLNRNADMGSVYDTSKLCIMLADVFQQRKQNH